MSDLLNRLRHPKPEGGGFRVRGEAALEIERMEVEIDWLRAAKALLIELVLEANLTSTAKNLVAVAVRDGSLLPTPEAREWGRRVFKRLNQQGTPVAGETK